MNPLRNLLIAAGVLVYLPIQAQEFAGLRTGNYSILSGVFSNPANIADSRYRFDVNVFSVDVDAGSNRISYSLGSLGNTFKGDSLKNQLFGNTPGTASVLARLTFTGPSLMFSTKSKWAFALTTRSRVIANVRDLNSQLFNSINNASSANLPYTIESPGDMAINVNAWTEVGVTVARDLIEAGPHFLKGGVTVRYLIGAGNAYMVVKDFTGTINQDPVQQQPYLTSASGTLGMGFSGINFNNFQVNQLTSANGSGVGADLGLVYEWRPDWLGGSFSDSRDKNKYVLRLGASLLDLGSISYAPESQSTGGYNVHVSPSQEYYLNDLDSVSLTNYKQHLAGYPQYFTPTADSGTSNYSVKLPTRFEFDLDAHLHRGFYLNASAQLSLTGAVKAYSPIYYNTYTLTPRFEGRVFGVYVPVSYNTLTKTNAGLALRAGPLYFGSGTILGSLFAHSKEANLFIGLHIAGLYHKHKKQPVVPVSNSVTPTPGT